MVLNRSEELWRHRLRKISPEYGILFSLPREIRNIIWSQVFLEIPSRDSLAILRASRTLYCEVSGELYRLAKLIITLDNYPFLLELGRATMIISEGAICEKWCWERFQHAVKQGFGHLPYRRLKSLEINVSAPRSIVQLCLQFFKMIDIADLINKSGGIDALKINFETNDPLSWWNETLQRPVRSYNDDPDSQFLGPADKGLVGNNLQTLLMPFTCIRHIQKLLISSDGHLLHFQKHPLKHTWYLRFQMSLLASNPLRSASLSQSVSQSPIDQIQKHVDRIFLQFHALIDLLPGDEAYCARCWRYSTWYDESLLGASRFENQMASIYQRKSQGYEAIPAQMDERYFWLRLLNPLSVFNQCYELIGVEGYHRNAIWVARASCKNVTRPKWSGTWLRIADSVVYGLGDMKSFPELRDLRCPVPTYMIDPGYDKDAERLQALIRGEQKAGRRSSLCYLRFCSPNLLYEH
ncbi:MAG: hypothetical protein Q9227_004127 [Pyrenula ochraceoflavens]